MKALLVLCVIFLFVNCNNKELPAWENPKTLEESVLMISSDSATVEQMALKKKLERLVYDKVIVVDNQLVLKVEKDYWEKHDISPAYEAILKESLEEVNRVVKKFIDSGMFGEGFDLSENGDVCVRMLGSCILEKGTSDSHIKNLPGLKIQSPDSAVVSAEDLMRLFFGESIKYFKETFGDQVSFPIDIE